MKGSAGLGKKSAQCSSVRRLHLCSSGRFSCLSPAQPHPWTVPSVGSRLPCFRQGCKAELIDIVIIMWLEFYRLFSQVIKWPKIQIPMCDLWCVYFPVCPLLCTTFLKCHLGVSLSNIWRVLNKLRQQEWHSEEWRGFRFFVFWCPIMCDHVCSSTPSIRRLNPVFMFALSRTSTHAWHLHTSDGNIPPFLNKQTPSKWVWLHCAIIGKGSPRRVANPPNDFKRPQVHDTEYLNKRFEQYLILLRRNQCVLLLRHVLGERRENLINS